MKTFIIQYLKGETWHNLVDDFGFIVEVFTFSNAQFIASQLGNHSTQYPAAANNNWQIVSSTGSKHNVFKD